jgi:hypothetical protein
MTNPNPNLDDVLKGLQQRIAANRAARLDPRSAAILRRQAAASAAALAAGRRRTMGMGQPAAPASVQNGTKTVALAITVCMWVTTTAFALGMVVRAARWAAAGFHRR